MRNEPKRFLNSEQRQKTTTLLSCIARDIKAGRTVRQMREKYLNERTGKPYAREYIYHLIRKMKKNNLLVQ